MTPSERRRLVDAGLAGRPHVRAPVWADLGCGAGAFTLTLADALGEGAVIYAIDRESGPLRALDRASRTSPAEIRTVLADLRQPPALPALDGILMANALHYVRARQQVALLSRLRGALHRGGVLLVIEYDLGRANPWVPHPIGSGRWPVLAGDAGYRDPRCLDRVPSRHWGTVYVGRAVRP